MRYAKLFVVASMLLSGVSFAGEDVAVLIAKVNVNDDSSNETAAIYWARGPLMSFVEATRGTDNYFKLAPTFGVSRGPWFVVAGLTTDSTGVHFGNVGGWFFTVSADDRTLIDCRYWWGISGTDASFFEVFAEHRRAFRKSGRLFYGLNLLTSIGAGPDSLMLGPVVGAKLGLNLAIFARPSRTWFSGGDPSDSFRVGLELVF